MNQQQPLLLKKEKDKKKINPFVWGLRELSAIAFWTFLIVKLFIFDFDVYIVNRLFPLRHWLLDYKVFVFAAIISGLWLVLGNARFAKFASYVLAYPFIIIFWKLPKIAFRNWPLTIAFAPAIHQLVITFRLNFILHTLAAISAVFILTSHNRWLLLLSMAFLCTFLLRHLYQSLKKAYQTSLFDGLTKLVKKLRAQMETGMDTVWKKVDVDQQKPETEKAFREQMTSFYLLNSVFEFITEKLYQVAKSRKPDLYLIACWIWTVMLTSIVYAFEYFGLYKIDQNAFAGAVGRLTFWSFLGFSFGKLTPSSLSSLVPFTSSASILCYSELACALIIFVILVFTVLTAARDRYKDDINDFIGELRLTAEVGQKKFLTLYNMALPEVENALLRHSAEMVKMVRKLRGLPELPPPSNPAK